MFFAMLYAYFLTLIAFIHFFKINFLIYNMSYLIYSLFYKSPFTLIKARKKVKYSLQCNLKAIQTSKYAAFQS